MLGQISLLQSARECLTIIVPANRTTPLVLSCRVSRSTVDPSVLGQCWINANRLPLPNADLTINCYLDQHSHLDYSLPNEYPLSIPVHLLPSPVRNPSIHIYVIFLGNYEVVFD